MPSIFNNKAALKAMFTVPQDHRCCCRAKSLMPCKMQVNYLRLCSEDKCALVFCMPITPSMVCTCICTYMA